jgi:hypothetical protein
MKTKILLFLFLAFNAMNMIAEAQPAMRLKSRNTIRKTGIVIHKAQQIVKKHGVHTGNLAKSIIHQRYAKKLFLRGNFLRSIHQSLYARKLALLAIKANKQPVLAEWEYEKDEQSYLRTSPSDELLQSEMKKEMPGASEKDEDYLEDLLRDIDESDLKE